MYPSFPHLSPSCGRLPPLSPPTQSLSPPLSSRLGEEASGGPRCGPEPDVRCRLVSEGPHQATGSPTTARIALLGNAVGDLNLSRCLHSQGEQCTHTAGDVRLCVRAAAWVYVFYTHVDKEGELRHQAAQLLQTLRANQKLNTRKKEAPWSGGRVNA